MSAQLVDEVERDDHYIHSVDFSPAGEYIYWTETGKTSTNKYSMGSMRRASLADLTTSTALNAKGGDVRHTHNGRMLTIGNLAVQVYTVTDPDGATPTVSAAISPYIGQGKLLSHMALQPVIITNTVPVKERVLGHKHYELTDHLGNVRAVVSDMKYATWSGGAFSDYHAQVESRADYYAFGSLMPGRHSSTESYRFAFNGKSKDDEIHGATGTSYDFGARIYDTRVGRWVSMDPAASKYPSISPYVAFANNPLIYVDPEGDTLRIAGDLVQAMADLRSMLPETHKAALMVSSDGTIFWDHSKVLYVANRPPDAGVELMYRLTLSDEHYEYNVSATVEVGLAANRKARDYEPGDRLPVTRTYDLTEAADNNQIINAAVPVFGGTTSSAYNVPKDRTLDGQVTIAPSTDRICRDATLKEFKPRASIVFHELWEVYLRASKKKPYHGSDGAHQGAIDMEQALPKGDPRRDFGNEGKGALDRQ